MIGDITSGAVSLEGEMNEIQEGVVPENSNEPSLIKKNEETIDCGTINFKPNQSTSQICDNHFIEIDYPTSKSVESTCNLVENDNLVNDCKIMRHENKELQEKSIKLGTKNFRESQYSEIDKLQLETLQKMIVQLNQEIKRHQEFFKQQGEIHQKQIIELKHDCDSKVRMLSKQYDAAKKEKDAMVMKYAVSEKIVIDLKREIQSYNSKIKESLKDKEFTQTKLKTIIQEKNKINQLLEAKTVEIAALERENSKRKDEIGMRDSKIKWAQNRLKAEIDCHAETQSKLEKLNQKFNEAKEEAEQYKKQTQAIIKSYQAAQEDKNNQEQEQKAKLIIDKYDEETSAKLQLELEIVKKRQQNLLEENSLFNTKVQNLEQGRLEYEENIIKMKETMDIQKREIAYLKGQLIDFDTITVQLKEERQRLVACQSEIESLHLQYSDMQQEVESCRSKEAELLEFTKQLTEKNVQLQSMFTAVEARAQELEIEHGFCDDQMVQLNTENSNLKAELQKEKRQHTVECELISKHLTEQINKSEGLVQEVADLQCENQLLKKKHVVTLKELTKEVQVCRKKLENYEGSQGVLGDGSRTSSNTSLNNEPSENKIASGQPWPAIGPTQVIELDRQVLIDKIVEIQKSNAQKAEKIEFLEEHVKQLVAELQKKTKIIQNYIMREQSGALASETMDHNKILLSKHGGIMASVYNSKAVDEGMTLELSLEINKKLQAVLEDTLLKNITLKENMETLGKEIAKLTEPQMSHT